MREAINFYYDGIYSVDMGVLNCRVGGGLYQDVFLSDREILEIEVRGREKPYFQGVRRLPLTFSLTFAFKDQYDEKQIRDVARWLDQDQYKPFYTEAHPEIIFYCLLHSDSELLHNGLRQGYVNIQMRCDSPYAYSPKMISRTYEWNETVLNIGDSSFDGDKDNTVVDSGSLKLNPSKTRWSSFSHTTKWSDL